MSRTGIAVAVAVLAAGLLPVLGQFGCGSGGGCIGRTWVVIPLSCGPTDLTSVRVSGPCSMPDAGLRTWLSGDESKVAVSSPSPGVCHIELIFATGFTYSTDVTFTSQSDGAGCPNYVGSTAASLMVNNPSDTCVAGPDAGADVGAADAGDGAVSCDVNPSIIRASSYDQTCSVDSDCSGITEGNACDPCSINCVNAAINVHALPQYASDNASLVSVAQQQCPSSCGGPQAVCCRSGKCQRGYPLCPYPGGVLVVDAGDAGADGGGAIDAGAE